MVVVHEFADLFQVEGKQGFSTDECQGFGLLEQNVVFFGVLALPLCNAFHHRLRVRHDACAANDDFHGLADVQFLDCVGAA